MTAKMAVAVTRRSALKKIGQYTDSGSFTDMISNVPSGFAAISGIREGYPARMLKGVSAFFAVPDGRIQGIVHVPSTTANRLIKSGARIDSAASERIHRMATVTRMAIDVFETESAAVAWMSQVNRIFNDTSPLDLLDTEVGAASVKQVLNAIATGGAA